MSGKSEDMRRSYLFVYGTLKKPAVQKKVLGRIIKGSRDLLEDYKKSKVSVNRKIYPAVIHSIGSKVSGLVISVTSDQLKLIDKYETKAYKRKKVILKSGKNVWVYIRN